MKNINCFCMALIILGGIMIGCGIIAFASLPPNKTYIFIIGTILSLAGLIGLITNKDKKN